MGEVKAPTELLHQEREQNEEFNIAKFFRLHEQFMTVKKLEGLTSKTLSDHITFMRYFKDWLQGEVKDCENRVIENKTCKSAKGYKRAIDCSRGET